MLGNALESIHLPDCGCQDLDARAPPALSLLGPPSRAPKKLQAHWPPFGFRAFPSQGLRLARMDLNRDLVILIQPSSLRLFWTSFPETKHTPQPQPLFLAFLTALVRVYNWVVSTRQVTRLLSVSLP